MKKLVISSLLLLSVLLIACNKPKEVEKEKEEVEEIVFEKSKPIPSISVEIPDYRFKFEDLKINEHIDNLDLRAFKHFGKFYTEDFSIFSLDRIDFLAESYEIEDIELFFIDSLLVKIQAFLRKDFSSRYMRRFGKAKISINDYSNKKLLEQEDLIVRVNGRSQINSKLDNYTLQWNRQELDIFYNVNRSNDIRRGNSMIPINNLKNDMDKFRYKLTVQSKDFKDQLSWIQWESYKEGRGLK